MNLILRIFDSKVRVLQVIFLVVFSAICETSLLFKLSKFGDLERGQIEQVLLIIGLTFLALFARLSSLWVVNRSCLSTVSSLNTKLLTLVTTKSAFGRVEPSGFISTAEKVQIIGTSVLVPVLNGIASIFVGLFLFSALIFLYGPLIGYVAATIVVFYLSVVVLLKNTLKKNSNTLSRYQTRRASLISESSLGGTELLITKTFDKQRDFFRANEEQFVKSANRVLFFGGMPRFILETALIVSMILVVLYQSTGDLGVGDLVAFGFGCLRLVPLAQQSYNGWARYRGNSAAITEIIGSLKDLEEGKPQFYQPQSRVISNKQGMIVRWSEKLTHSDMAVPFELKFRPGYFTFLSGASGSGKTTLIFDLLASLWAKDISVGLVAPHNARLTCSVADYLSFFCKPDPNEITSLIKALRLDVANGSKFLDKSTVELSTGEFQRLQIVRELLRKPQLLVFDESLSNLDKLLVQTVIELVRNLPKTSVLIVSHNLVVAEPVLMEVEL